MKITLLLFVLTFTIFQSFGQYSRSIYAGETNNLRNSSIIDDGTQTTIISVRESSGDTLRVTFIDIDESGETSNYRKFEYSPFDISFFYNLSGVGLNAAGDVTLCVLSPGGSSTMNISYISVNPTTGTFSNYSVESGLYRQGGTRTVAKGDSLITYLADVSGSGIHRVSRSMSSTALSSEEADASATYAGSLSQNGIKAELIIDGNEEYLALEGTIIKRTGVNSYISTSHSGALLNAPSITVTSSGELFVLNRNNGEYKRLDGNLTTLTSGTLSEITGISAGLSEIYALPNNAIRVWTSRTPRPMIFDIDASNSIISQKETRCFPTSKINVNGKQYTIGFESSYSPDVNTNGVALNSNGSSIAIVYDDLNSDIADFIEYDQLLSSDKIQFNVNHLGKSFTKLSNITAGFLFHQNNIFRSLIFAAGTNTIGETAGGDLKGTTTLYNSEMVPGPYTNAGDYTSEVMDKYNRGYYVTQEMIETHIFEITTANPAYKIPFGIREWPAHGDVSKGQAANLAKFIDQNGNGTYEPELGDYPAIYGEQCLLNIYHHHANAVNSSSIETHQYYFTFDCDSEEAIENTVFIRTHEFARDFPLQNTYSGNYVDFDIGFYGDDYAGTNVELGMTYAYNGDQLDETNAGVIGFQDTIPAVGLISLQGVKLEEDGIDNATTVPGYPTSNGIGFGDAIADNEFFTMESSYMHTNTAIGPNSLAQWHFLMSGLDLNGLPKTVNGVDVRHDYFGTSDPIFYTSGGIDHGNSYSEATVMNPPGDRRMSSASGPRDFTTSDTMVQIKAFVVGVDTQNLSPENSVNRLFEHGQTLRTFFAQNADACGNTFDVYMADNQLSTKENELRSITAYPNPSNHHVQFQGIQGNASLKIFDLNGRAVISQFDVNNNSSIDVSSLDNAIYLISITDELGTQTIRMVKQ